MGEEISEEYRIEQFTLEEKHFAEMAHLIDMAFNPQTKGGTIAFDEQTLRLMFGCPYTERDMFVRAVYIPTEETVGFTGGIPRNLSYKGIVHKFGVPTFQSVHKDHQRKGLAVQMNLKMIEVGKQLGYEGGFASYEPEAHGIDAILRVVKDHGLPMKEVLRIRQFVVRSWEVKRMAKVVPLKFIERVGLSLMQKIKPNTNPRVRVYRPEDAEQIFALMRDHVERNELSVVREKKEFIWYLNQPGVVCVVHENPQKEVDGFMVAWKMNLAGFGHSEPFGWLDTVHIYRLAMPEAIDLSNMLCIAAKVQGWAGLQTPFIPYFDATPFKKAKFIFYSKKLLVNIYLLKPVELPDKVESFYFDWR